MTQLNNNSKLVKSSVWYVVCSVLTKGMGFFTLPIFTRLLTKEEFGYYNNYASWLQIITIVVSLNLAATLICAKYDFRDSFENFVASLLFLSFVSVVIWFILFNLFSHFFVSFFDLSIFQINCILVYIFFENVTTIFLTRERLFFEYKRTVFVGIVHSLSMSFLSVLFVVLFNEKVNARILGNLIPIIIIGLVLLIYLISKSNKIQLSVWKYAFPICLPYIPHLLSLVLLGSMDRIMIFKICGEEDAATYSLAHNCGTIITFLLSALNEAYAPWLADNLHNKEFKSIRAFSFYYILIFIYFTFALVLFTPEVLMILGGKKYLDAKYILPPVAMGCVCQFIYIMYVLVEQICKKTNGMAIGSITAALINYILNAIFIPRYGFLAAAFTTLISYLWLFFVHMFLVYRLGYSRIYNSKLILGLILGACMITGLITFSYQFIYLRVSLIVLYLLVSLTMLIKFKSNIILLLNTIRR